MREGSEFDEESTGDSGKTARSLSVSGKGARSILLVGSRFLARPTRPPCTAFCSGSTTRRSIVCWEKWRRFKSPKRRARRRARVAVDGTGLSHNAASTFFIRRIEQRRRGMTRWSYWWKWLIVADLDRLIILAQRGRQAPWCDCRSLPDLVDAARGVSPIGLVLADAEFYTEQNHRHIREQLGAHSIIQAKRGRNSRVGIRGQMRRRFPQKTYRQRAKVETVFSIIKRKFSARAPGRSLSVQKRQASLLGLTYNLHRLRHRLLR